MFLQQWVNERMKRKVEAELRSRPPRITFIATDLSSGGGVNRAIRDQAVLLDQLGADITVVNARSDRPPTYAFPPQIGVQNHRAQSFAGYFLLLLGLRRTRPDVLISSWTQDNILATAAFLGSPTRVVNVEHTSHCFHGGLIRGLRRLVYPLASALIVLNPAELRHYRGFLSNVRLLPNCVPASSGGGSSRREKLILAVGHLEERKNFAHAIHAMARSGLETKGWSLAIVGEGPQEDELRALIAKLGLKRTSIHPPTADIGRWYRKSSLTLVTSTLEVFSLVLAEAMQAGVVPIAYATDGPSFILEEFPDHLVDIGDVDGLATRLAHFASVKDLETVRRAMRSAIEDRFSASVIGGQWREFLVQQLSCQLPKPC